MTKIVHAVFDGKAFQPKEPVDFAPNTNWILFISSGIFKAHADDLPHPFEHISALATDMGPADLSENFDRYIGRRLEFENA